MKNRWIQGLLWGLVLLMMSLIFLFSCQGGQDSMATSGRFAIPITNFIAGFMPDLTSSEYDVLLTKVQMVVRKTAHFTEYALLGCLICLLMKSYAMRHPLAWAWLAATLYAGTDEIHQWLGGERTGMWQDVLLDSMGALTGCVIVCWIVRCWRKRHPDGSNIF